MDEFERSQREIERLDAEMDEAAFVGRVRAQHHADQWDARMVESLRQLGRDVGQQREYQRRIDAYLDEQGY